MWWHTFQRLRPEEFSSGDSAGDSGLRSFLWPEIYCEGPLYECEYGYGNSPILKLLRFFNFGRKLLRPELLESVPQFFKKYFCPKASAHRTRSPHIDVLETDSGQPYAGEWTNCLRIGKSVTRKVGERFTDRHLANENDPRLYINKKCK